jgi:hypothetical protein
VRQSIIPQVMCVNLSLPQSNIFLEQTFNVAWGPLNKFHTCLNVNYISASSNVLLSFTINFHDVVVSWWILVILYAMMAIVLINIINLWLGVPVE